MTNVTTLKNQFLNNEHDSTLTDLYYDDVEMIKYQKERYVNALDKYIELFGEENVDIYSAPGRTEVGGNHTDHQHGMVLAASVNLDAIAIVGNNDKNTIELLSEGYSPLSISLDNIAVNEAEFGTTSALIKGVIAGMNDHGYKTGPFKAYVTSDVLNGAGLSSSAAFETLIATAIDRYYNQNRTGPVEIAKIGQYAENYYFGKKSGLMDQMVCSAGGFVFIDFNDIDNPDIHKINFDFNSTDHELVITDTRGNHSDLTDDYTAIRTEMEQTAEYFGKKVLRQVDENLFWQNISEIRKKVSDRAVLRAAHFFGDNRRAVLEAKALSENNFSEFLNLVNESGASSENYLQNLYSCRKATEQAIPIAIMTGKRILNGKGAIRVHGGGFAGTVQAFVPAELVNDYRIEMNRIFGDNSCYILTIRPVGGIEITGDGDEGV